MNVFLDIFRQSLSGIYSSEDIDNLVDELITLEKDPVKQKYTSTYLESDAVLITYADSVTSEQELRPLQALRTLITKLNWQSAFPVVHLLPFFPWDTDRGFSVCDFYRVAEENGIWEDVHALAEHVRLMFDFVANHASIKNPLVQGALIERHLDPADLRYTEYAKYKDFVLAYSKEELPTKEQLEALSRPRAAPVLTPYFVFSSESGELIAELGLRGEQASLGDGFVWTTFSRGVNEEGVEETKQVDLNYKNPAVFLEALKILLFYAQQRASWIRLDAIGYLWKNLGSASLHEEETHKLLEALHAALAYCAPEIVTVAEVNEPQEKVMCYLGEASRPQADMVYQFTHFPLSVHALYKGDASWYRAWLVSSEVADGRQFVTVLGSHDGMGLKPLRGILSQEEIEEFGQYLIDVRGGLPNYAKLPGGKQIVYEVCSTSWELINGNSGDDFSLQLARYQAIVALGLMARGVPAFYFQSVFGAKNFSPEEGLDENRTINRKRFDLEELLSSLTDTEDAHCRVNAMLVRMLSLRSELSEFLANSSSLKVFFDVDPRVVAVMRSNGSEKIYMLVNVSSDTINLSIGDVGKKQVKDLISGELLDLSNLKLEAYQVCWLK